jgi:hypothetical protein
MDLTKLWKRYLAVHSDPKRGFGFKERKAMTRLINQHQPNGCEVPDTWVSWGLAGIEWQSQ